jgi:hypothetical protein
VENLTVSAETNGRDNIAEIAAINYSEQTLFSRPELERAFKAKTRVETPDNPANERN